MAELLIKNALIASSRGSASGCVIVKDGLITQISRSTPKNSSSLEVIDAKGMILLPGLIDTHVHLRDPGALQKEDFFTGTKAAIAGGFTSVMDMPNNNPPCDSFFTLQQKHENAGKKAVCDYAFHFGSSQHNYGDALKAVEDKLCNSMKIYFGSSTGGMLVSAFDSQISHFNSFPHEKVICVHAEDEEAMKYFSSKFNENSVNVHNKIRDPLCAELAVSRCLSLAEHVGRKVHICHSSTRREVELVAQARKRGVKATCEVTAHHLFLNEEDAIVLKNYGKMNPPLRSEEDRLALWELFNEIDLIASDHAPHTRSEKDQNYDSAPSGVPGLETTLPLLLTQVNEKTITLQQVVEKCAENPAGLYGLKNKGFVQKGMHADFVLVDLKKAWTITSENLNTKCKWTPFEGRKVKGKISKVFLRGNEVFDGSQVTGVIGSGKAIEFF